MEPVFRKRSEVAEVSEQPPSKCSSFVEQTHMQSKFYGPGSSSEDEDNNNRSESESEEDRPVVPSRFALGGADSSDDDTTEKKRVVRSVKDRRADELYSTINSIKNHLKIDDWNAISVDFEKLNKQLQRVLQINQKEGLGTPRAYIKTLALLEDRVKATQDAKAKGEVKMNATKAKAFNAMRQKLKKNNKLYEKELEEYRKNPDADDEISEEKVEEKEESESEEDLFEKEPSDEEKDESEESEESESDTEQEKTSGISKWLKKDDDKSKVKEKTKKKKPVGQRKAVKEVTEKEEKKPTEMSPEEVRNKLKEILGARGKRGTDPQKQLDKLTELLAFAKDSELQVELLTHLISAQFDVTRSVATHMPLALWKSAFQNLQKLLKILEENPSIKLQETEEPAAAVAIVEDEEESERLISGNLRAFIERLDDEYLKSLQAIDPHTQEYVQRLQDESAFLEIAEKIQAYYEKNQMLKSASRIAARRLEHLYYKTDVAYEKVRSAEEKQAEKDRPQDETPAAEPTAAPAGTEEKKPKQETSELIENLVALILSHGDERMKTRAMLCNIYYKALHDKFYEARDMMLMSHLQDNIGHMDIPSQILFNRAMVQTGLCAFRANLIKQAHSCLAEICSSGRVKELLAQGITSTKYSDKSQEQEKQERKRQLPYHMHINLELLEAVHLICAMLLEVPNMAASGFDTKKKIISRPFRRLLDYFERQVFTGPPETTRDVIITAAKALNKGNWKRSEELLLGLSVWNLLPKPDKVKDMLKRKIQEEGLRTYLFNFSVHYDSMSLDQLCQMFELPRNVVHSLISKMMISEELHASWDQPTGAIIMHKMEPTRLQQLALQLAEKAAVFVENNERLLDTKNGNFKLEPKQKDQRQGGSGRSYQRQQGGRKSGYQQRSGGYQQQGGYKSRNK